LGALLLTFFLPLSLYLLWGIFIYEYTLAEVISLSTPSLVDWVWWIGFLAWQVLCHMLAPSHRVGVGPEGLLYRLNGLSCFVMTCTLVWASGLHTSTLLADRFFALMTCANITSFALSVWMYCVPCCGVVEASRLKLQRDNRGVMEKFWMGRVLHPRMETMSHLDLKFFCEGRPGLMMWVLMNFSFAASQLQRHGEVSLELWAVTLFQAAFILDFYLFEDAILTTKDILDERFGLMMIWGDLVFVPFFFSIQCHAISLHPPNPLPLPVFLTACLLSASGLVLFRLVNGQKHEFMTQQKARENRKKEEKKKGQREKEEEEEEDGDASCVLSRGYWGWSRHPNYAADILQSLGWCLMCGSAWSGWMYWPYLVTVFVHRERRDDQLCLRKFGAAWESHRTRVPWRIFKYIY
jgi:delta14-sterol reductase